MSHRPTPRHDARTDAERARAFVADGTRIVHVAPVRTAPDAELRAWIARRDTDATERLKRNERTLFARCAFRDWSQCMAHGFTRTLSLDAWRNERNADAVLDALRRCTVDVHTATRRDSGIVTLRDGTRVHVDSATATRERERIVRGFVEARRTARRYRNATLRNAYRGTLTSDGMALSTSDARNRLAPLDSAIALSDTIVTRHGSFDSVRYARNVVRHDDGSVDDASTLSARRFIQGRRETRR